MYFGNIMKNMIFYCDRIPSIQEINDNGVNCASFVNLLIQYARRKIPENTFKNSLRGALIFGLSILIVKICLLNLTIQ